MAGVALNYDFRMASRRKAVRMPVNPMDKTTIVSIYPRDINHKNITIEPGVFHIPAGTKVKPGILIVGTSSWWKDADTTLLEIPVNSFLIADSVIRDYCTGLLSCNMANLMPGLFYIPGEVSFAKIITEFKAKLDEAELKQNNWYRELVKMADVDWQRTQQNPLAISNDARLAAQELGLKDKAWMGDFRTIDLIPCVGCGGLRNPQYPICPHCKTVADKDLAAKLGLKLVAV